MNVPVDYKVEDSVPIPVRVANKSIPIEDLEVGQSILFPLDRRPYVQTKASRLKGSGKVFTVSKVDDKNARVWRKE